jgi:hypothetical protein
MRNPYGRGKLEDRPTPETTHGYHRPFGELLLGSELRVTLCVVVGLLLIVIRLSYPCYIGECYENHKFLRELWVDAHGTILDIIVVGVIVLWLNQRLRRRLDSIEYQDQIDSLRGWRDKEAGVRILYYVRLLNRNGVTSIFLSDAVFDGLDLRGDGEAFGGKRNADMSGSYAPHASFCDATVSGISFREADLQQANFTNAYCSWADFSGSLLLGVNFTGAVLTGAKFLGARFLRAEDLAKARSLDRAELDGRLKQEVIALRPEIFEPDPTPSSIPGFFAMFDPNQLAEEFRKAIDPGHDPSQNSTPNQPER